MAWNLILVKYLLSDGIEHGSVANDSSNILKAEGVGGWGPSHLQIDGQDDQ